MYFVSTLRPWSGDVLRGKKKKDVAQNACMWISLGLSTRPPITFLAPSIPLFRLHSSALTPRRHRSRWQCCPPFWLGQKQPPKNENIIKQKERTYIQCVYMPVFIYIYIFILKQVRRYSSGSYKNESISDPLETCAQEVTTITVSNQERGHAKWHA